MTRMNACIKNIFTIGWMNKGWKTMMNEWSIKDYDEWMKDKRLWWMNEGWKTMMNEWRMKDYDEWMKDERLWWMNGG